MEVQKNKVQSKAFIFLPILRSSLGLIWLCWQRNMGALGFRLRSLFSMLVSSASLSETRSVLFSIILSAKHTCCSASLSIFWGLTSSSRSRMYFASVTVMMLSSLYISSRASSPLLVAVKNVWTTFYKTRKHLVLPHG